MKYTNPIIPGCYPDPSICRVGEDFYVVNSSFEFFPGVPIFHSRDLINWTQIGHCITRNSQLIYTTGRQSRTGIYAPTIRYHEGIFYMITTDVAPEQGKFNNFYVWTEDPSGEWSEPVFLETEGIDPSLFFDEDGKAYYTGTSNEGIYVQEIDVKAGKMLGSPAVLWKGTGGSYPEGPHLYTKDGWYYLMISEGGTERCHMLTMARSKKLTGPYEACSDNPVMTNRSLGLPIQSVGHADLVMDQHGTWWAVCLGTRTFSYPPRHNLGRETMLVPVDWNGDWPVFGLNGNVMAEFEVERLPAEVKEQEVLTHFSDNFSESKLGLLWNFIYNPDDTLWSCGGEALKLHGNENTLKDGGIMAWVGCRQQHHNMRAQVLLEFDASRDGEEAGMTIYMNECHHYEAFLCQRDNERKIIFRRQIGSLVKEEVVYDYSANQVLLELRANQDTYCFFYGIPEEESMELGGGEVQYLTTEVGGAFTGNYIALYSTGNGNKCCGTAVFSEFNYWVCE